jgi:hypothetical protein
MEKQYKVLKSLGGSFIYRIKINGTHFTIIQHFNRISGTYLGCELRAMDDAWYFIQSNPWVLNINTSNVEDVLKGKGFEKVEFFEPEHNRNLEIWSDEQLLKQI